MPHRKSPKAALPYLPLEVEEIIIDQLSDNTNALRSCTLTRWSWVTRSQFHLLQAIRIKTRAQLDVLYRHFDANPPRRALVRSVTVAPDSPKERAYLLGIFPHALLTGLPSLRTWVIQDVDASDDHQKTRPGQPNLSFHKTTLTQLRYTTIEELHLSHILFGSDGELIRLIVSLPHLRHLQYTHLHFRRHGGLVSPGSFTRILHSLSTLDIHVQDTEDQIADALIKMAQLTLRSLTLRLHPRARWGSSPCSSNCNPVWLKLDSLTLHVEPDGDLPPNSLPDFVLEICQYATDRISTLHHASTVKELAIHVTSSASLPSASLALRLINSDYFLDRFRSLHLDLVGQVPSRFQLCIHLPPRTQPRGVIVQGTVLASDNFVFEESYQQQVQYYSEGNIWRTATKSESDSVVALAISPDGKWIASGSRQHAIVWNAITGGGSDQQYLEMVHEWIAPVDDDPLTRPFAFAPDSLVLACCTRDPEAFIQVRDVITGELLAVLRAPGEAVNGFDACRASCVWSRNSEALTSVVFIPSQHKFVVQVWNAENYRMISTTTEITSFHSPSFLYSPNRHWLASCQTARGHYVQTSPPVSFMRNVGAGTMLGAPLMSVPMDCHILSATFDQSSTRFAAVSSDHVLHVWSLSTGTKLLQVPMNEYPNDSERLVLTFSPDGTQLLSCSGGWGASFVLTARDASTGRTLLPRRPGYHFLRTRTAPRFVFSDDRRHLLSASEDGVLQLWLAADASFVRDIARGGAAPTTFVWSEDGKILAWGTEGGGVVVKPL